MTVKGWAITAGLGAAAGAVAIMMMPRNNPATGKMAIGSMKERPTRCKTPKTLLLFIWIISFNHR